MFSNYFTLKKYTENFLVKLVGNELLQVYTQRENRLTFEFLDFKTVKRFDFVIHSKLAGFVPQKFLTRSKQAMDFFLSCKNKKITKVFLSEQDRLIFLELSNSQTIVLRIFGKDSNVFLLEKDRISDAFKKLNFVPNEKFEIKKRSENVFPQDSFQSWFTAFQVQKVSAEDFLKQNVNFLGKTFFNEILFRSNEKTLETFYLTTQEILVEIDFCKPKIYLKDGLPFKFSLCELKSLGEFESKNAENLEDALEYFYRVSERNEAFENRKNHCLKLLST
ncbi:NFACT family protein, partial [bacterium]|nr:NFACT family protein [bacterium]